MSWRDRQKAKEAAMAPPDHSFQPKNKSAENTDKDDRAGVFVKVDTYKGNPPKRTKLDLVVGAAMKPSASSDGGFVLELTEAEWKEHQSSNKFAGLKISYSMLNGKYNIKLTEEQYSKYKQNCAGPQKQNVLLKLTPTQWKENHAAGSFAGINIQYTKEGLNYVIELTEEEYDLYKKNCEHGGFLLVLTEQEWKEHQSTGMFAGLKISYTLDEGKYNIRMTEEQYTQYKQNQGGYCLNLSKVQYEELSKNNVFAGINVNYTIMDGQYIIRLTNEEYDIYQKNRIKKGEITSMQYNITIGPGGHYNLNITKAEWERLQASGGFVGLDVSYTVSVDGNYIVQLSPEHYKVFISNQAKSGDEEVFSLTVDAYDYYILNLSPSQYQILNSDGSFTDLNVNHSVNSDGQHIVKLNKPDYHIFIARHNRMSQRKAEVMKQFNVVVDTTGHYTLTLSAPQWALLQKHDMFTTMQYNVKLVNGCYVLDMSEENYNIFVMQHAHPKKPGMKLDIKVNSCGRYILRLTSAQWVTLRNQGAFVGLNVEVTEADNGDHIINLSAEEYEVFQASQAESEPSIHQFNVSITTNGDYVLKLTSAQWKELKNSNSFGDMDVTYTEGPNGEFIVVMNGSEYETFQSNRFQIAADAEAIQRDNIQKRTFTRWANVQLKPKGMIVDDLYEDLKDGLNLIQLLETLSNKSIKKTAKVRMNIHKLQNLEHALRHLDNEGVKLVNISNEDILSGNHKLTLGLIWTIICRYQFENLSMGNVSGGKLKSLLLAKCNQAILIGYPPAKASNFTSSFQDGMAFCAMISAHAPDAIDMEAVKLMDPIARHELAFKIAEERFGVSQLLEPSDTVTAPDEKSIMTYIAALTAKLPDLGPHVDVSNMGDYMNQARALKVFLDDKKNGWDNNALPANIDTISVDIQSELDSLRAFGANQMPAKHKEIELLTKAYKDIEGNTDNDTLKIIIEEGITPPELNATFNGSINAKKGREQRLLALLKKKENEGDDIKKIEVDCATVNIKLKQLEGEVNLGKTKWPDATQPEIKRDCARIDGFIDVITAEVDAITKKYNELAEYATNTETLTPIAVEIDNTNAKFEAIIEDYRSFMSRHMKDSEDSLLNTIKELSEKLDAKRAGLSNIQWTNDLPVLKACISDVDAIQQEIVALEKDVEALKTKHESLTESDPLYGKFDTVLERCIEKYVDTKKQADRSHHDLTILKKFLEGVFQELPWIKKQEQSEIKRRWHIVVDPSAMPPCSQVEYQAELQKLTQHESSIHQLINVAKNLIKESPELDVLVQEPMFRLEVEWKRLYNLMQCCNTQLKIYEENLPFYRILNSITKNTHDVGELLTHPNKEDPTKYKQQLEQHNKNIEIGLNQLEKLDKLPSTGYYIDRTNLPSDVKGLGDVYLRGEKILRPGDHTQVTRVGDNLVCEVKLDSGKKELLPIVYFTRPYEPLILSKFIMHHKQRVEEINVKIEALTKDIISQAIVEQMDEVMCWEDLPEMEEEKIPQIKSDCQAAIDACMERGDHDTADVLRYKLSILIEHTDKLTNINIIKQEVAVQMEVIDTDIQIEMEWVTQTETQIDQLLCQGPPGPKSKQTDLNVTIYDDIATQFPAHEIKQKEISVMWSNVKDKKVPLEKDFDPQISGMQDVMRKIKAKKNDLYDKTTLEYVEHSMKPLEAWVDVAKKRVDQIDVDGDLDKLKKIVVDHNVFLEDMRVKEQDMDKLNSKWEEGVDLGIDNPEIQRRINKLNQDWDELCDLAENKRDQTNNAMTQMEAFDEAVDSVLVWVNEKQDVLKNYATIPLDRDKLDRMLGEHEVTVRDVEDRKPSIEAILEKGGQYVEAAKHPATKKAAQSKLKDLGDNFTSLTIDCDDITRQLKDALGHMGDLDDRLTEVVRWEDESKDYISKQEAVSEEPTKLKEQWEALVEFKGAVDEMRPEVDYVQNQGNACLDKYGDQDQKMKELKAVLVNVNVNWEFIEIWLKDREGQLNAAQKKNKDNLFADIDAMIKWLSDLKQVLSDHQVKTILNVNPIIEVIKQVQADLDVNKPKYTMLCEASAVQMPLLEEPTCFELEAKTDKMVRLWNELCRDCEVQTQDIENFVNRSAEVDETLDNLLVWANKKYGELLKLEEVKPEQLPVLLKPHENEVEDKAPTVISAIADVEQLLGPGADKNTEDPEVLVLVTKHEALTQKWQDIQDELEKLRKRAHEYTDQETWFLDTCLKMDKWLQIKRRFLLSQTPVTMETFSDELKVHRDLMTEYEAKQIEFGRIWEISHNIIRSVADPNKKKKLNTIRNKLSDLWEEVYGLCMTRHYQFIEILKAIYRLEFRLVLTVEWLVEVHYRLKSRGDRGDFVQDLVFLKEIENNQRYIHHTFEEGRKILRCVRAGQLPATELPRKDTLPNIEKHLIDLHNHWERLLAEIVLEKQRLDQVMAPLENHVYRLDKMLAWLLAEQKKVEKDNQLGGTWKQLNKQLTNVRNLEQELNTNKERLVTLNEQGYQYLLSAGVPDEFLKSHGTCLEHSVPQIDDNITYIAAMNTTWGHLECHVREMKVRLEDLTDGMEKFDRLITTQHAWLNQCQARIQSLPSDSNGAVENENIIADLTTLHTQVLATVKIGLLIIHQHGECVLPTISKILDLTMHFDNICSEAHSKHCNLDMAKLQLKLFKGSLDGMLAWLRKKTEAIEEQSGYVSDDQDKIKELLEWHSKLSTDIERHRAVRDTILDISERFIKEGHTSDTASLKISVNELKSGFSNLEDAFKKFSGKLDVQ